MNNKTVRILGIRGVPATHGGFETFAENLAPYLVERGWRVIVYCQEDGTGPVAHDTWCGVERVRIPVPQPGPLGTIIFDWKSILHAAKTKDLCLTLGYNTALFCAVLKLRGIPNVINMDGIEWARAKWSRPAKAWFWLNERAGCWLGDHLIADHPEIKRHLATRVNDAKITTIAYGAPAILDAPTAPLESLGVSPGQYLSVIARPEPENSLLEIVEGFSSKRRGVSLLVLGNYSDTNPYHRQVKKAASDEVRFVGAIYDKCALSAIRFHSLAYVHGHQVGGTNPSLVEALGAGNAVLAHDNRFNRWVAGSGARHFHDSRSFSELLDVILNDAAGIANMQRESRKRFAEALTWAQILSQYESLLHNHTYKPENISQLDISTVKD